MEENNLLQIQVMLRMQLAQYSKSRYRFAISIILNSILLSFVTLGIVLLIHYLSDSEPKKLEVSFGLAIAFFFLFGGIITSFTTPSESEKEIQIAYEIEQLSMLEPSELPEAVKNIQLKLSQ